MSPEAVADIIRQALVVALQISSPLLVVSMVVGLTISIFQSVTQINEMTLTFVPKILVFAAMLMVLFPWILKVMTRYTLTILVDQWDNLVRLSDYAG